RGAPGEPDDPARGAPAGHGGGARRRAGHEGARGPYGIDALAWAAGALIILGASFVMGLAGFGIGLVSLAFLPYLMAPAEAVVLSAAAAGWSARTIKANLQAFFVVNQVVILAGYWWAGLLTREVWRFAAVFAAPAVAGIALGMGLFNRIDPVRFRRIVFALLFVSGLVLLVRG